MPNLLESELLETEVGFEHNYPNKLRIFTQGEVFATCPTPIELIQLLNYFQVTQREQAELLLENLGFQSFNPEEDIKQEFGELMETTNNFIIDEALSTIYSLTSRQMQLRFEIERAIQRNYSYHPSVLSVQFIPFDFKKLIEILIQSNGEHQFSNEENEIFKKWLANQNYSISSIFLPCYDVTDPLKSTAESIQEIVNKRTNNFEINSFCILELKNFLTKCNDEQEWYKLYKSPQSLKLPFHKKYFKNVSVNVVVREVKGKLLLATKDSNLEFLPLISLNPLSNNQSSVQIPLNKLAQLIDLRIYESIVISLGIKDIAENISYDLIEHLLGEKNIANYLRNRKIYYRDEQQNKNIRIHMQKGILCGEVFYPQVANNILNCISIFITKEIKSYISEISQFSTIKILKNSSNSDFLFSIQLNSFQAQDNYKILNHFQFFQNVEGFYNRINLKIKIFFGLELDYTKSRLMTNSLEASKVWCFDPKGNVVRSNDFVYFGEDLLNFKSSDSKNNLKNETRFLLQMYKKYQINNKTFKEQNSLKGYILSLIANQILDQKGDEKLMMDSLFIKFLKKLKFEKN